MSVELQPYVSRPIPELAIALQSKIKTSLGLDVPFTNIAAFVSDYVEETEAQSLELSRTKPDFEQIKSQMQSRLRRKDSWRILLQAGVGETLLEFVATIGDYAQTSIQRAYQETSYDGRLTSSILTITRTLGVHIDRKVPAQTEVQLYGDSENLIGNLTIPPLSQFSIGGISFFNREAILVNNNTKENPLITKLYQGRIQIEFFMSTGAPFQSIEVGQDDYRVADKDIYCYIDDVEYESTTEGLWRYGSTDQVFYSNTTPNGNVELLFGNGIFGNTPKVDTVIKVVYAQTDGDAVNSSLSNQSVTLVDINDEVPNRIRNNSPEIVEAITDKLKAEIVGITTSAVYNGGAEKDADFYRAVGPGIRASRGRMVNRSDHYALGLNFPNVADVLFQGQKQLAPRDRNYINVVGVTVLTKSGVPFTPLEWENYVDYLTDIEIARVNFVRIDPTPVVIDVKAKVFCTRDSDDANVGAYLKFVFTDFFKLGLGSLGKSVYNNDVEDMLKANYLNIKVDYAQDVIPKVDFILRKTQYPVLGNFDITVGYSDRSYKSIGPRVL